MWVDKDNWQEIFDTIRKNKLRTVLTMLGVFWGIFMLVIMLGSGNGLRNGILKQFGGTASNSFFCWTQKTTKPYKGFKGGRSFNFRNADIAALSMVKGLEVISPQNQLGNYRGTNKAVRGTKTGAFAVMGLCPNITKINRVDLGKGRYLNDNDMKELRKVCVIGPRVYEVLFNKGEEPLGKYIQVNGVNFMVVGVTAAVNGGERGRDDATKIAIPFTTFQKAFNYGDVISWFAISANPSLSAEDAEKIALDKLKEVHSIAPDDMAAIGHWNMGREFKKLSGLFTGIEMLIWVVGCGTLIAGIIGISNIMLIVVKERTREIGVKRALGATPFHIIFQILLESMFLTSIAGYLGLMAGIYTLEALNGMIGSNPDSMFTNPTIDISVAIKALVIIIIGGLFAGFIPAKRATDVHPVEALRAE